MVVEILLSGNHDSICLLNDTKIGTDFCLRQANSWGRGACLLFGLSFRIFLLQVQLEFDSNIQNILSAGFSFLTLKINGHLG
jgi:hypothetical protein